MTIETRSIETEPLELRAATTPGAIGTVAGWAMRYDAPSLPLPFTERFAPGSFTCSLKSRNDVRLYVNHDDTRILASTRAKTLRLDDRAEGLWIEGDLPDTSYAHDLRALLERGDVYQQSVGFSTVRDEWSEDGSERRVVEARLHETSIVTAVAAYPLTTASVRTLRVLALRAMVDADALAEAMAAMQAGGSLTAAQVALLTEVVDSLAMEEPDAPTADSAAPEPECIEVEATVSIPLSLMRARLELLERAIA